MYACAVRRHPFPQQDIELPAVTDSGHCPTRLLSDEPAPEDTFGGPHERLAAAITDLIANEEGGKAIGLEGGWGAGKSTVVQLVTRKLEEGGSDSTRVVVFDVWAHQGDPLRRTFLEKLIRHLQGACWVSRDVWNERVEQLTKRRREETQRVIPQLTNYGIAFALSLLAIPTGSAMIAAGATLLGAENASTRDAVAPGGGLVSARSSRGCPGTQMAAPRRPRGGRCRCRPPRRTASIGHGSIHYGEPDVGD